MDQALVGDALSVTSRIARFSLTILPWQVVSNHLRGGVWPAFRVTEKFHGFFPEKHSFLHKLLKRIHNTRCEVRSPRENCCLSKVVRRDCHQALAQAIEQMGERCDRELEKANLHVAQRDVLNSLKNHWLGLTVFVKFPQVPMDNNTAERRMRNPGMGRKNYYGSASQWSAELAAMLFSLFQTVLLWKLNPHHWLYSYLTACAENGGQPPADLSPFIPWMMSEERQQQLAKPMPMTATDPPQQQYPLIPSQPP